MVQDLEFHLVKPFVPTQEKDLVDEERTVSFATGLLDQEEIGNDTETSPCFGVETVG
jgi:hypothetical protein